MLHPGLVLELHQRQPHIHILRVQLSTKYYQSNIASYFISSTMGRQEQLPTLLQRSQLLCFAPAYGYLQSF